MAERKHRVLIIDADLTVEESLRPTLAHYGYTTHAAPSASEGQETALRLGSREARGVRSLGQQRKSVFQ